MDVWVGFAVGIILGGLMYSTHHLHKRVLLLEEYLAMVDEVFDIDARVETNDKFKEIVERLEDE